MDEKQLKAEEGRQIKMIRDHMPGVHQSIRERAALEEGVYAMVRRGMHGETDCFYAFENARVVGTPFCTPVMPEVAAKIVEFGATFLFMLASPTVKPGAADGAD